MSTINENRGRFTHKNVYINAVNENRRLFSHYMFTEVQSMRTEGCLSIKCLHEYSQSEQKAICPLLVQKRQKGLPLAICPL